MKKLFVLLGLISMIMMVGCGGKKKPTLDTEVPVKADSVVTLPRQEPRKAPHFFSGDLSKYYHVRICTVTPLSRLELEAMNVDIDPECRYYIATIGLVRNNVPFEFTTENIECMYDVWLVPSKFPDGKFNVHAQVIDSHNNKVAQLDFHNAVELKDLLRKCPHEGDFMIIEDMFAVERSFDQPSNKFDIRGYIKPAKP